MVRRCCYIAFVVLVPLAVLFLAGRSVVMRDQWAKRRLHEILTIQAAQALKAEVRVGAIEGNILTSGPSSGGRSRPSSASERSGSSACEGSSQGMRAAS